MLGQPARSCDILVAGGLSQHFKTPGREVTANALGAEQ